MIEPVLGDGQNTEMPVSPRRARSRYSEDPAACGRENDTGVLHQSEKTGRPGTGTDGTLPNFLAPNKVRLVLRNSGTPRLSPGERVC